MGRGDRFPLLEGEVSQFDVNSAGQAFEIHFDPFGRGYQLGLVPTPAERRACANVAAFSAIPESDWRPINRRALFAGLNSQLPQRSTNGCVGFSAACAASKLRILRGQPFRKLSGAYLYSLINDNRDQGAMIIEALAALESFGVCPEDDCPLDDRKQNIWRKNTTQHDAAAAGFKAKGIRVDSAELAVAVLLRGGILEFGVKVGRSFSQLNAEGVLGFDSGYANHAVHADGLVKTPSGRWCLDMENTWGYQWGDNGRGLFPVDRLEDVGYQECFGIIDMVDDPSDAHDPPQPK